MVTVTFTEHHGATRWHDGLTRSGGTCCGSLVGRTNWNGRNAGSHLDSHGQFDGTAEDADAVMYAFWLLLVTVRNNGGDLDGNAHGHGKTRRQAGLTRLGGTFYGILVGRTDGNGPTPRFIMLAGIGHGIPPEHTLTEEVHRTGRRSRPVVRRSAAEPNLQLDLVRQHS